MSDVCDLIWGSFAAAVEQLNAVVRPEEHGFISRLERSASDRFPLRALASYSPAEAPGDEQLVISLDVGRERTTITGHVDLARGDGLVLADAEVLPSVTEDAIAASPSMLADTETAVAEFVARQEDAVLSELRGSSREN
jgi:hypothetical protein